MGHDNDTTYNTEEAIEADSSSVNLFETKKERPIKK